MRRNQTATCLLALLALCSLQADPSAAQAVATQTAPVLESLRTIVIKAIGAQDNTVEIGVSGSVLKALRINSNLNASTHAGRNNEASAIALVAAKAIAADSAQTKIDTIRVQYLTREGRPPSRRSSTRSNSARTPRASSKFM